MQGRQTKTQMGVIPKSVLEYDPVGAEGAHDSAEWGGGTGRAGDQESGTDFPGGGDGYTKT